MRQRVESTAVQLANGERHHVTASLGVATFPCDCYSSEGLVGGADKALYESKKNGRNRVEIYYPDTYTDFVLKLDKRDVRSVSVVGNFNGWDVRADPMTPQSGGSWQTRMWVVPGTYEYKFVVNGEQWLRDPARPEAVGDGY